MQPDTWTIGKHAIVPLPSDELDNDPRGILYVWEPPRPTATYVIAIDPTVGKTGWSRWLRTDDDLSIDNAAIEIIRKGLPGGQDVQVAEFAAPIDAIELAPIANALGRLYAGANEEGQAYMIGDVVGPGAVTLRELIDRFGYTNHFLWRYYAAGASSTVPRKQVLWWQSSRSANRDLWMRGLHHIHKLGIRIHSPHLVEEMSDCMADSFDLIGEARYGRHDDRIKCLLYGIWALHDWALGEEPIERVAVEVANPVNWQATDLTAEECEYEWDERMEQLQRD